MKKGKKKIKSYKDLIIWQKAIELAAEIYLLTERYPGEEKFGLVSQMRRAVVSISSNIAEGKLRDSNKEEKQFFSIAFSSGGELESQIEVSKKFPTIKNLDFTKADTLLEEVMKMLNTRINNLSLEA